MRHRFRMLDDDDSLVLPARYEEIGGRICAAAREVMLELGPGMREAIYGRALVIALTEMGAVVAQEVAVDVDFRGTNVGRGYAMVLLVEDLVVVEIKSVPELHPSVEAQLLTYMRGYRRPLGYVINFGAPRGRKWIHRKVLSEFV